MTTALIIEKCKTIIDKYGSPALDNTDWVYFINMAQQEVLNRLVPDELGGQFNFEVDSNTLENIKPLVFTLTLTPSAGLISSTSADTALQSASGDGGCSIFRVLNMGFSSSDAPIKFVKHNNLYAYKQNFFKAPSAEDSRYTIIAGGFQIYPSTGLSVKMTVVKTPKVATNTGESLDWDDYVTNQLIFETVKLAGVPIHDDEVIGNLVNSGIQAAR